MAAREHRLFMISVVSEMLGIHPQTLTLAPAAIDAAEADTQVAALGGKVKIDAAKGEITLIVCPFGAVPVLVEVTTTVPVLQVEPPAGLRQAAV